MSTDVVDAEAPVTTTPILKRVGEKLERNSEFLSELWGRRLQFTPAGKCRLAIILGYAEGLSQRDPGVAEDMLKSLDRKLHQLANYGGDVELGPEFTGRRNIPAYKVIIGDDCWGLGSFTLAWYVAVPYQRILDEASKLRDEILLQKFPEGGGKPSDDDRDSAWYDALKRTKERFRVYEARPHSSDFDLDETVYRQEAYEGQPLWCRSERYVYCYSFNGGLIMHWDGAPENASWSIHT